jgi:hypothetical protein
VAVTKCLNELTSRDWWQIISIVKCSHCLTSKNQCTAASLQMYVQTLVPLCCYHCCSRIYHLASFFSQLLKMEHFPSTNFHPYNLKHRSTAGLIDLSLVWAHLIQLILLYGFLLNYAVHICVTIPIIDIQFFVIWIIIQAPWLVSQVHTTFYCVALVSKLMANLCVQ